jgi:glutaredoxin
VAAPLRWVAAPLRWVAAPPETAGHLSGEDAVSCNAVATLYRCNTPTDWLCPCGRVARALRREGIAFQRVVVGQRRSRREEVEALSGQRRVPVLVLDGDVICDSKRILEHLEYRRSVSASPSP